MLHRKSPTHHLTHNPSRPSRPSRTSRTSRTSGYRPSGCQYTLPAIRTVITAAMGINASCPGHQRQPLWLPQLSGHGLISTTTPLPAAPAASCRTISPVARSCPHHFGHCTAIAFQNLLPENYSWLAPYCTRLQQNDPHEPLEVIESQGYLRK